MGIRVAQWGTGNVGAQTLATVITRPDMEIVAVHVTSGDKVGRDAGDLARGDPIGVAATGTIEELLAAEPDVVLHMPLPSLVYGDDPGADVDDFCTLLSAGVSVVTTVGYMYPAIHGPEVEGRIARACASGGSSFHGTGANPGWFGDLLPLLMTGLSLRVDQITVQEISNFQHYPSPEIMFEMMNFGCTPEDFVERAARHRFWLDGLFTEAVQMVAEGLGCEVDAVESDMTTWIAEADYETAAGTVAEGTVAGQRWEWHALVGGEPLVRQETVWRMHRDAAPDWPQGNWSITISGNPAMEVHFDHGWNRNVLGSTGAHAINVVQYLMDDLAANGPGIKTFLDLPLVAGRGAHH